MIYTKSPIKFSVGQNLTEMNLTDILQFYESFFLRNFHKFVAQIRDFSSSYPTKLS